MDKDYDGTFDTKKIVEIDNHQAGAVERADATECNIKRHNRFYPATLKTKVQDMIDYIVQDVLGANEESDEAYSVAETDYNFTWTIKVQEECEKSDQHKDLLSKNNITQGLKKGLSCMYRLAIPWQIDGVKPEEARKRPEYKVRNLKEGADRTVEARNNLYKAVAELVGFDYLSDEKKYKHKQKLTLVCEVPKNLHPLLFNRKEKSIYARATVSGTNGLESHENHLRGIAPAPNIVFTPKLKKLIKKKAERPDYPGETESKIVQKLMFHEYLHTALGTTHKDDSVDMAETCATICFNKPSSRDKLGSKMRDIAGEICGGNFSTAQDELYKEKIKKFNCYRKAHRKYKDKEKSKIPTSEQCDKLLEKES